MKFIFKKLLFLVLFAFSFSSCSLWESIMGDKSEETQEASMADQDQIELLTNEVQTLENAITEKEKQNEEYSNQIANLTKQIEEIQKNCENEDCQAQIVALSAQIEELKKKSEESANQIVTLEGQLNDKEGQITDLQGQLEAKEGQITALSEELSTVSSERDSQGAEIRILEAEMEKNSQDFVSLVNQREELEKTVADQSEEIDILIADNAKLTKEGMQSSEKQEEQAQTIAELQLGRSILQALEELDKKLEEQIANRKRDSRETLADSKQQSPNQVTAFSSLSNEDFLITGKQEIARLYEEANDRFSGVPDYEAELIKKAQTELVAEFETEMTAIITQERIKVLGDFAKTLGDQILTRKRLQSTASLNETSKLYSSKLSQSVEDQDPSSDSEFVDADITMVQEEMDLLSHTAFLDYGQKEIANLYKTGPNQKELLTENQVTLVNSYKETLSSEFAKAMTELIILKGMHAQIEVQPEKPSWWQRNILGKQDFTENDIMAWQEGVQGFIDKLSFVCHCQASVGVDFSISTRPMNSDPADILDIQEQCRGDQEGTKELSCAVLYDEKQVERFRFKPPSG